MTLLRPPRPQLQQVQEPQLDQEMLVENQVLGQISEVKNLVVSLRVALLGGVHNDIPSPGRLPLVENAIGSHEERIKSLEDDRIRWKAYAVAAAAIGGVMGSGFALLVESAIKLFAGK